MTRKELKKEFAKHLYEASVSFPATSKAETLCCALAFALVEAKELFVYCNNTGNVKNIQKTWFVLDQRLGELLALVNSLLLGISGAKMAAGGRIRQLVSKTRQPKRAAKRVPPRSERQRVRKL